MKPFEVNIECLGCEEEWAFTRCSEFEGDALKILEEAAAHIKRYGFYCEDCDYQNQREGNAVEAGHISYDGDY
jgi:hypothetical protein